MSRIPSDRIKMVDGPEPEARNLGNILKAAARKSDSLPVVRPLAGVLKRGQSRANVQTFLLPDHAGISPGSGPLQDVYSAHEVAEMRDAWALHWRMESDAAQQVAVEEAFARGQAEARLELENARAQFEEASVHFNTLWHDYLDRVQPQVAELAFAMASGILASPLPDELRSVSVSRLAVAVERMGPQAPLLISVHPVELMRLQETGVADQMVQAHPGLRWIGDAALEPGDWVAHCNTSVIRHVASEMLQELRDRLHLPSGTEDEPIPPPAEIDGDEPMEIE